MKSLEVTEFLQKYKMNKYLVQGAYGKIFLSYPDIIIKKQNLSNYALRELIVASQFTHPNICPVLDVCFSQSICYMAMPKGESIFDIFNKGLITVKEILTDLISVFAFLRTNHVFHGDLKPINVICLQKNGIWRVCLIDFGLCAITEPVNNDEVTSTLAYTDHFADPEYAYEEINSIKCEMYSIATTIYYILERKYPSASKHPYYITREMFQKVGIQDEDILNILMEFQVPIPERKDILDFLEHPAMDQTRLIHPYSLKPCSYRLKTFLTEEELISLYPSFDYIIYGVVSLDLSLSTLMGAFDIFHRYLSVKKTNLSLLLAGSLFISSCVYSEENLSPQSLGVDQKVLCLIISDICNTLDFDIVSDTQYYALENENDVYATLSSFYSIEYDSSLRYHSSDNRNSERYSLSLRDIMEFLQIPYNNFSSKLCNPLISKYQRISIELDSKSYLYKATFSGNSKETRKITGLVASREYKNLKMLSPSVALRLFNNLLENARLSNSYILLSRVVKFDCKNLHGNLDTTFLTKNNIFSLEHPPLKRKKMLTEEEMLRQLWVLHNIKNKNDETYIALPKSEATYSLSGFETTASSHASAVINFVDFLKQFNEDIWSHYLKEINTYQNVLEWIKSWFNHSRKDYVLIPQIYDCLD